MKKEKILSYIKNPLLIIPFLGYRGFFHWMKDEIYLKLVFRCLMGYWPDLKNPKTFNEKMQWMKLHDRNPLYTKLVDKYEVKKIVADIIGEKYIIPTLGVWDKFDDIDFDKLPEQFVLKCTHDSGGLVICKDKSKFDIPAAKKKIEKCLKMNYFWSLREWPYKNVPPRIIAEKYMEDSSDEELRDYKFYTFNGNPKFLLLATNRQSEGGPNFDYFDMEGNHLPLTNHWHPQNTETVPHMPQQYNKMQDLCKKLANNFPQARVDFYEVDGNILFGEMTFFDQGGFLRLHPDSWAREWGDLIRLQ